MEEMDPRGEKEGVSQVEEFIQIVLDPQEPNRVVTIGSLLGPSIKADLTRFLRQNKDVFVWSHQDMPGIDP